MYSENQRFKTTKLMVLFASLLVMFAFMATMAYSEGSVGVGTSVNPWMARYPSAAGTVRNGEGRH